MTKEFEVFKCKLVKEKKVKYIGKIASPDDAHAAAVKLGFETYSEEILGAFGTDIKGNIITYYEIAHGDLNTAVVHPREVYKRLLLSNCGAMILVHNHPSGDVTPSEEDVVVTKRLAEIGDLMGVPVLDHLIIGSNSEYYSMKANDEF